MDDIKNFNPWTKKPPALSSRKGKRRPLPGMKEMDEDAPKKPSRPRAALPPSKEPELPEPEQPDWEDDYEDDDDENNPFASIFDEEENSPGDDYSESLQVSLDHEEFSDDDEYDEDDDGDEDIITNDPRLLTADDEIPTVETPPSPPDLGLFGSSSSREKRESPLANAGLGFSMMSGSDNVPEPKSMAELRLPRGSQTRSPGPPVPTPDPMKMAAPQERQVRHLRDEPAPSSSFDLRTVRSVDMDENLAAFVNTAIESGLTEDQINALVEASARDSKCKEAIDMLLGKASLAYGVEGKTPEDHYRMMQNIAVNSADPEQYGLLQRSSMNERLKSIVRNRVLIDKPFDLEIATRRGESPGYPTVLGRLSGMSLGTFEPLPLKQAMLYKRGVANGAQFLQNLLGDPHPKKYGIKEGDYVVISYNVVAGNGSEKVYVLTPVLKGGESFRQPSSADETGWRLVQGIVHGFQVEDTKKASRHTEVVHPLCPYVLTCKMVVRKGTATKGGIPLEGGQVAKAPNNPIYFLEPAILLSGNFGASMIKTTESKPREKYEENIRFRKSLGTNSSMLLNKGPQGTQKGNNGMSLGSWY